MMRNGRHEDEKKNLLISCFVGSHLQHMCNVCANVITPFRHALVEFHDGRYCRIGHIRLKQQLCSRNSSALCAPKRDFMVQGFKKKKSIYTVLFLNQNVIRIRGIYV